MLRWIFLFLFIPHSVFAWGETGHKTIGELAEKHLTPKAKNEVKKLLGSEDMASASVWADVVRSNPKYRFQSRWHYINLKDGQTYKKLSEKNKTRSQENVVWAINLMVKILKDQASHPRVNKPQALKLLIHFVGDLHQPLHAGRRVDRGGNQLYVRFFNRIYRLHEVWDSEIIKRLGLNYKELVEHLEKQYQKTKVQQLTPEDWANESTRLLSFVYFFDNTFFEGTPSLILHQNLIKKYPDILSRRASKDKKPYLHSQYLNRTLPISLRCLYKAGVRLANLLNTLFP